MPSTRAKEVLEEKEVEPKGKQRHGTDQRPEEDQARHGSLHEQQQESGRDQKQEQDVPKIKALQQQVRDLQEQLEQQQRKEGQLHKQLHRHLHVVREWWRGAISERLQNLDRKQIMLANETSLLSSLQRACELIVACFVFLTFPPLSLIVSQCLCLWCPPPPPPVCLSPLPLSVSLCVSLLPPVSVCLSLSLALAEIIMLGDRPAEQRFHLQ